MKVGELIEHLNGIDPDKTIMLEFCALDDNEFIEVYEPTGVCNEGDVVKVIIDL